MTAFKLEYKDLNFTIELDLDSAHKPIERWNILSDEDKELLASGEMAFFNLTIISENANDGSVKHFIPGVQLPVEEEDQMEDLEIILIDDGLLDEICSHWELRLSSDISPKWSIT